jgi:diketogulonate reductase-like aldo/keto reductase
MALTRTSSTLLLGLAAAALCAGAAAQQKQCAFGTPNNGCPKDEHCHSGVCVPGGAGQAAITPMMKLNDGKFMPRINLGTCCGSSPSIGLKPWLEAGGIGIDTSIDYHDEADIGAVLKATNTKREDVYITTKITAGCGALPDCGTDPAIAMASVKKSLANLGVSYIDMMLLHRPCQQLKQQCSIAPKLTNCSGPSPIGSAAAATKANNALWKGLQMAQAQGMVKSIGVSNYFAGELAALEGAVPAINQCEMSIQGYDNATIKYCQAHGIVYESYGAMRGCPFTVRAALGWLSALRVFLWKYILYGAFVWVRRALNSRKRRFPGQSPRVATIAAAHKVSAAQVCPHWAVDLFACPYGYFIRGSPYRMDMAT